MTTPANRAAPAAPFSQAFPTPGPLVAQAYRTLLTARNGTDEEREQIGDPAKLPRPWDPPTCAVHPDLYTEVMQWLDAVVDWLTIEYTWAVKGIIPPCWLDHPHLIHEIAVLTDQRRNASHTLDSNALEEWHQYALPGFTDRMTHLLERTCDSEHRPWPARSRYASLTHTTARRAAHLAAVAAQLRENHHQQQATAPQPAARFRPRLITTHDGITLDPTTGEIHDEGEAP